MATTLQRLEDIVTPIVAELGLELFDLEYTGGVVRVTIDTVPDEAGVAASIDLADITAVTHAVSRAFDEHDPIVDRYSLEVSSPGLERTLRTPRHFERAIGQRVAVKTVPGAGPERRLVGDLVRAGDGVVPIDADRTDADQTDPDRTDRDLATSIDLRLDDDDDVRTVAYADIAKARTVFEWGPEPRPQRPPATQPKQPKQQQKQKQKKVETS